MRAKPQHDRIAHLSAAAMLAAITALLAQIAIPLGPVPLTLQTLAVLAAACLFSPRWAAIAMSCYVGVGAVGLPVYSAGRAGFGYLLGPTGGFLFGFILGALLGSWLLRRLPNRLSSNYLSALAVVVVYDLCALPQMMLLMNIGLKEAAALAILPVLPFDLLKVALFVPLLRRISAALHQQFPLIY
ncbi:MAG: biotin transporter BioY [Bacillota bacterium]|nr:biotin transporter BioY [Bacillota bacterium]